MILNGLIESAVFRFSGFLETRTYESTISGFLDSHLYVHYCREGGWYFPRISTETVELHFSSRIDRQRIVAHVPFVMKKFRGSLLNFSERVETRFRSESIAMDNHQAGSICSPKFSVPHPIEKQWKCLPLALVHHIQNETHTVCV